MSAYISSQPNTCSICGNADGELRDSGECVIENGNAYHYGTVSAWCPSCGTTHEMEYQHEQYRVDIYEVFDNPV